MKHHFTARCKDKVVRRCVKLERPGLDTILTFKFGNLPRFYYNKLFTIHHFLNTNRWQRFPLVVLT